MADTSTRYGIGNDSIKIKMIDNGDGAYSEEVVARGKTSEIERIINAVTIAPGGNTGFVTVDTKGAKKIIVGTYCTQKWRMRTNSFWADVAASDVHMYPDRMSSDQNAATLGNYPTETVIGMHLGDTESPITTMVDALKSAVLPANLMIRVENKGEENATITVRIMRIWEA